MDTNYTTNIPNEIMDALAKIRIPGESMQVLNFIIRKTIGWHKDIDSISLTQFSEGTGLDRRNVCLALRRLIEMNLIIVNRGSVKNYTGKVDTLKNADKINKYMFNKDINTWNKLGSVKNYTVKNYTVKNTNGVVKKITHTKQTNITKQNKTDSLLHSKEMQRLSELLYEKILIHSPNYKKPIWEIWCKHICYLIEIDNKDPTEIEKVIEWCQADPFWFSNILSTKKLREKYQTLYLQMERDNGKNKLQKNLQGISKQVSGICAGKRDGEFM